MSAAGEQHWRLKRYDVRCFLTFAAVALAYFCAAKFGLIFAFSTAQVSAVWPPSGIAIAALVLIGYRIWPALLIGAFATNITLNEPALTAAAIAVGNTLGPLVAAWVLRRIGFDPTLARVRDAVALMAVGTLGTTISATNGVANLALANIIPWPAYFGVWGVWSTGDAMGVLVVAPLILSWAANWRVELSTWRLVELGLLCASMVVLALMVLTGIIVDDPPTGHYKYMLFLGVVWAAMRFGQRGTSVVVILLVGFAVWDVTQGRGPFIEGNLDQRLIDLSLFVGTVAVTGLLLATVTAERERARVSLQQTHDELAAAESRLRTVIANAPLAIWSIDTHGRFTFVDGAVLSKVGIARQQMLGAHYAAMSDENAERAVRAVLEGQASHLIGDYAGIILETHMEPLRNERDEIVGAIGVSIDVTERRRVEMEQQRLADRMQHAQKLESLGVLAGGIAHDFNNLLTAIVGNADLALMHSGNNVAMREHIGQIELAAHRAADLTRQMLDYAGKGQFKVIPLNLSQAVQEMAQLLAASVSKKANLSYHFAGDLPLIEADPAQVSQVAMNLITNASDALGAASGSIAVSTGVLSVDAHTLAGCLFDDGVEPGRFVYVEVSDTGVGMDPSIVAKMFEPFFTTKFVGRGLGLSAVRGIMRGHKGTLSVTSRPGEGTTMRALFPVGAVTNAPKPGPQTTMRRVLE